MKIPFFFNKKSAIKYYLGILLEEDHGSLMVMKLSNKVLTIEENEKIHYSNGWENLTEDIDNVLSLIEKNGNYNLEETIFFVYSHLIQVETKQIKKPFLDKIKGVVKNLELQALGFIECHEAVIQYLEKKEELPLTATILEIDKSELAVIVYKGGKSVYSGVVAHTDNIVEDLQSLFMQLKESTLLPSRIIIYSSHTSTHEVAAIAGHKWREDLFVQLPRVELLKEHDVIESLRTIFEEQLVSPPQEETVVTPPTEPKEEDAVPMTEVNQDNKEVLGFVIDKDINTQPMQAVSYQESAITPTEDIIEESTKKPMAFPKLPTIKLGRSILPIIGLLVIIVGLFINEYFMHTAVLTVFLPSQTLDKKISIITSTEDTGASLPVHLATDSANLSASTPATGKKDIGEKAKGEVTMHNFDDKEKVFVKGTVIENGGIKFVLDDEVKVASASLASDGSAKLPGKSKAKVTASAIGPESNFDKGKRFQIDDLASSSYFAINDNSFSGGTKKTVLIVSKKDIDDLKKKVLDQANKGDTESVKNKFSNDEKVLTTLTQTSFESSNFSHDVGEEAQTVTLKAKVTTTYYFIKDSEAKEYIAQDLKDDLTEESKLQQEKITYSIKDIVKKNQTVTFQLDTHARSVKEIDTAGIVKDVTFKNKDSLNSIIKDKYGAQGYQLDIREPIPFFKSYTPLFKRNISVKISYL